MKLFFVISLISMTNIVCNGSNIQFSKKTLSSISGFEELTGAIDFPEMEYPQSILDPDPFFLKSKDVLSPFTEDVKNNFKSLLEKPKTPVMESITLESTDVDDGHNITNNNKDPRKDNNKTKEMKDEIDNQSAENSNMNENSNVNQSTDTVNIYLFADDLQNQFCEPKYRIESPVSETESSTRRKRSPSIISRVDNNEYDSDEDYSKITKGSTMAATFTSAEAVLPRPPLAADDEDGIIIRDASEEEHSHKEILISPICEEHFAVNQTHIDDDGKDL